MKRPPTFMSGTGTSRLVFYALVLALCGTIALAEQSTVGTSNKGSLFDRVFTGGNNINSHDIPYPFEAIVNRIRGQLEASGGNNSGVQQVLIPLGRSLQRFAAQPDYFRYPRVLVAVDGAPSLSPARGGLHLKDRLFLGYQEKANTIEIISYHPERGRFEFQIIDNYGPGLVPSVAAADRKVCTGCHQNEGPIWSDPPWDETNESPEIARRLKILGKQFHAIPTAFKNPSRNRSLSISNAVDRANMLGALQMLWQLGCGESSECRGELLKAILKDALRVRAFSYDVLSPGQVSMQQLGRYLHLALPKGVKVPNPRIANRNPIRDPRVTQAMDPLTPRAALKTLNPEIMSELRELISGFAGLFEKPDIWSLDRALIEKRKLMHQVANTTPVRCTFSSATLGEWRRRILFSCGHWNSGKLHIEGRFYFAEGVPIIGKIDRLQFSTGELLYDLTLEAGAMRESTSAVSVILEVRDSSGERRARRSDGHAVEKLVLTWRSLIKTVADPDQELFRGNDNGSATLEVVDDFSLLPCVVDKLVKLTQSGEVNVLGDRPFNGGHLLAAVLNALNSTNLSSPDKHQTDWKCSPRTGITLP